jgi:arginase family enzyme
MEKDSIGNFCKGKFASVGYPDELGVKNVNGRLGTQAGPARFFEIFNKLNGKVDLKSAQVAHVMVEMGDDLSANHHQAADDTRSLIDQMDLSQDVLLAVGGGHDYAYPWLKAFAENKPEGLRIACLNIDAHFDLRPYQPTMTSGSPFRRLIEEKLMNPALFVEFGVQAHCNSAALFQYAEDQGMSVIPFESLRNGNAVEGFRESLQMLHEKSDMILISLDLDAISFAFAPGVSAPQAEGFTSSEVFQMLEIAGSDKKVTSLGIFELAPALDTQDLTSRLAAQAAWHFLSAKLQ